MLEREIEWQANVLATVVEDGFRVSSPVRAADGLLVVEGWTCWRAGRGEARTRSMGRDRRRGGTVPRCLAGVPEPSFLASRSDPWAIGDRVAWGEMSPDTIAHIKHLTRLLDALRPVDGVRQIIHGDLTGNVLFASGFAPGIIDLSPYYRPRGFASAVVVCDAPVFEGADAKVLESVAHVADFPQYLLRALIYRAVTDRLFRLDEPLRGDDADPYLPVIDLALELANA
jgi:uncharacterized protein (TIGR02569 family)